MTCRACETTCPSGVNYGRLLDIGREQVEKQVSRPFLEQIKRTALRKILPYPQRFSLLLKLARFTAPLLPQTLAKHIPQQSPANESLNYTVIPQQCWMLVLDGCVQSSLAPNINKATAKVLQQLGISLITAPTAGCCGTLSFHLTAIDDGLNFARRNIDAWLPYLEKGMEAIVITASGCGVMVKEYGELLKEDSQYAEKARRISAATRDIVEIVQAEDLSRLNVRHSDKIAVQSPCTLQHGQNKIAELEKSQPDVIATANIGCLTHLESKTQIPVQHWIEIVAAALY